MITSNPEVAGAPPEDPHVLLARFLDESVERARMFFISEPPASFSPSSRFDMYTPSQFHHLLVKGTQTVNALLADLGGTPVVYDDEGTGTTIRGTVEGCAGFDPKTCQWKMVVNTPELAQRPGMQRLEVGFRLGEFHASYLRAKSSDDEPPNNSYGFLPGRRLGRIGLSGGMPVRPALWHVLPAHTGLLKN